MTFPLPTHPAQEVVLIRCSTDVARLVGAVAPRQSPAGLVMIDPSKEIFIWTRDGQKFAWWIV